MPQTDKTGVVAATGQAVSNFLSALRGGLQLLQAQDSMFANILAEAASAQQPGSKDKAPVASGDHSPRSCALSENEIAESVAEDRAAIRAMMQRIREDSKELYHQRQRIRHAHSRRCHGENGGTEDVTEEKAAGEQTETVTAATPEEQPSQCDQTTAAEETATGSETANSDATSGKPSAGDEAVLAAVLQAAPEEKPIETESKMETADGHQGETPDSVMAGVAQTEQAVATLLRKLIQEKSRHGNKEEAEAQVEPQTNPVQDGASGLLDGNAARLSASGRAQESGAGKKKDFLPGASSRAPGGEPVPEQTVQKPQTQTTPDLAVRGSGKEQNASGAASSSNKASDVYDFMNRFPIHAAPQTDGPSVAASNAAVAGASATVQEGAATSQAGARSQASSQPSPSAEVTASPVNSYDFASQLSAARVTKGGTAGLPSPVEQIALQLHKQVKDGQQEMTIQLKPAELGRIDVKLSFLEDGKVKGTVIADHPATLELLLKDVGSLQRALQDAGLRADSGSLQFSLRGDGQAGSFNANMNNGHGSSGQGSQGNYAYTNPDTGALPDETGIETYYLTPGRVNLHV